ncbi:MAG TPA: hypothetical protein VEU98_01720 [Candidatus Eremiobacteraceae bacterium]|nr:hypothetical protein [Candidatus Eremiobacteraceae bacterium]
MSRQRLPEMVRWWHRTAELDDAELTIDLFMGYLRFGRGGRGGIPGIFVKCAERKETKGVMAIL